MVMITAMINASLTSPTIAETAAATNSNSRR